MPNNPKIPHTDTKDIRTKHPWGSNNFSDYEDSRTEKHYGCDLRDVGGGLNRQRIKHIGRLIRTGCFNDLFKRCKSLSSQHSSSASTADTIISSRSLASNSFPEKRFAIKRFQPDGYSDLEDIAKEARFLTEIVDPQISAFIGKLGDPTSTIRSMLCGCIKTTLTNELNEWKLGVKKIQKRILMSRLKKNRHLQVQEDIRLRAAYELALAMKDLHAKKIILRDLNPEIIGFDFEGKAKLYNFRFAKELKPEDRVGVDQYKHTRLTISPRYQAREVYNGEPYGFSADSYSFSLLLWQILKLEVPYRSRDDTRPRWAEVYKQQLRPMIDSSWPRQLEMLMHACWEEKPSYRIDFSMICRTLERYFTSRGYTLRNGSWRIMDLLN